MTVIGFGFNPARRYSCVFTHASQSVSSEAAGAVSLRETVCVPPVWDSASLSVDFTAEVPANPQPSTLILNPQPPTRNPQP